MSNETFDKIRALDNDFYAQLAASFSETRASAWPGWKHLAALLEKHLQQSGQVYKSDLAYCENLPGGIAQGEGAGIDTAQGEDAGSETAQGEDAQTGAEQGTPIRVLDLAAGNGRFETFLARALPQHRWHVTCVDSCAQLLDVCHAQASAQAGPLAPNTLRCDIVEADILRALQCDANEAGKLGETSETDAWNTPDAYDLVVSFGFMHHIYSAAMRSAFAKFMVSCARPDGIVAFSCWSFAQNAELAAKAEEQTRAALDAPEIQAQFGSSLASGSHAFALEEGDYLLGWQGELSHLRFCHSFSAREVDELACAVAPAARVLARFRADGRTGDLNEYLVLQKVHAS